MDYQICRPRKDDGGTPFTNWVKRQPGLESNVAVGYVCTDVDLIWYNYNLAKLMLLEEKRQMHEIDPSQEATESILDQALNFALNHTDLTFYSLRKPIPPKIMYCGYHLIQFEHTGPEDGDIYIDGTKVTKQQLILFLQFKWTPVIQVYKKQAEQIKQSRTLKQLDQSAKYIRRTVHEEHPETELLRKMYRDKLEVMRHINLLFPDVPMDQDLDDSVG